MNVLSFEAHNVMGLEHVRFDLAGRHLFLVGGRNEQGKTSVLKAFLIALCGRSGCDFPEPALRNGEDSGYVKIRLSPDPDIPDDKGLTVQLKLNRRLVNRRNGVVEEEVVEEIMVLDHTGQPSHGPRGLLHDLYRSRAFDPLEFSRMKPVDQRNTLCELLGINLDEIEERKAALIAERKALVKDGKRDAVLYEQMEHYPDAPSEPLLATEVVKRLEAARSHNKSIADGEQLVAETGNRIAESEKEIAKLEAKLAKLRKQVDEDRELVEKAVRENHGREPIDVTAIEAELAKIDETNEKVAANAKREESHKALDRKRAERTNLNAEIDKCDKEVIDLLQSVEWPLAGMSIAGNSVMVNGVPLETVNKATRTLISALIGMMLNPKLRLMVCEGGSDLDNETLQTLNDLLKAKGFQMILEVVTRSKADEGICAVVMREGRAYLPEPEAETV